MEAKCSADAGDAGAAGMGDPSEPLLPPELLLAVASHFQPGSRSLLEMALACKSYFELLLPRLKERFSLARLGTGRRAEWLVWRLEGRGALAHIRHLDLVAAISDRAKMRVLLGTRILEALSADISVDLGVRHLVRARLPHLKCLKIRIGEFESGYNPASLSGFPVLPSLERLELGGDVPWRFLFVLAKRCPKLEQIDLRAKLADVEDNWHLIPGHILAKITSLTAYPDQLASIRTTSALRPRVLRNGDHIDHTTLENLRMLLLHVQSIEELHVHQYIGVHTPVSDFLLLPALASLSCVEILEVRVLARLLPPTLRSLSVKVLKWHTPLDEPDNLDRLLRSLSDPSGLRLSIQCLSCVIEGRPRRFQAQQSLSKLRELVGTGVPEGTQVEGLEALEAAGDLSYRED